MQEFIIETFSVRTGVPFGYLFFMLLLLGLTVFSLYHFVKFASPRTPNKSHPVIAGFCILFISVTIWASIASGGIEFNNHGVKDTQLYGEWVDGKSRLVLYPNGTFSSKFISHNYNERVGISENKGKWHVSGSSVILVNNKGKTSNPFRILKFREKHRLILDDFKDPDLWDGRLAFKNVKHLEIGKK